MTWIIGDIHGCLNELEALLKEIPDDEHLVFLGDYIDRGPNSSGVISRVLIEKDRSIFIMGNHESMLLAYLYDPGSESARAWTFSGNGGEKTLDSYGLRRGDTAESFPKKHLEFYKSLHLFYETEKFIAVHAGLRVNESLLLEEQHPEDLLWIRMDWIKNEHLWPGKRVFFGHTPSRYVNGPAGEKDPIYGRKSTGLDTGCVYGGYLTALNYETGKIIQIAAKKAYAP